MSVVVDIIYDQFVLLSQIIFYIILHIMTWNSPPPPVTDTTWIIPFLVRNPYKPSFVTITGWGVT